MLHVIALAQYAITYSRSWAADSINTRVWQAAEIDQLRQEVLLQKDENRIKDARMALIDPPHRPHYPPVHRNNTVATRLTEDAVARPTHCNVFLGLETAPNRPAVCHDILHFSAQVLGSIADQLW